MNFIAHKADFEAFSFPFAALFYAIIRRSLGRAWISVTLRVVRRARSLRFASASGGLGDASAPWAGAHALRRRPPRQAPRFESVREALNRRRGFPRAEHLQPNGQKQKMARAKGSITAEKIIEASLELFNKEGERFISTNHIATYLNMSPGNLYYYFRNKYEIISRLFERYCKELLEIIDESGSPSTGEEIVGFVRRMFDAMWKYRFFFFDVNGVLSKDESLMTEHNEFVAVEIPRRLVTFVRGMRDNGLLKVNEEELTEFVVNFWIILKYWFVFDRAVLLNEDLNQSKRHGVDQVVCFLRPYLADFALEGMERAAREIIGAADFGKK